MLDPVSRIADLDPRKGGVMKCQLRRVGNAESESLWAVGVEDFQEEVGRWKVAALPNQKIP